MTRYINPSGNVKYDNEDELKEQLEKYFFPTFFDKPWKPQLEITKEVWISHKDRIDYCGLKNKKKTYIEVKNWFVTHKDMIQIAGYEAMIQSYNFYVICGGIEKGRQRILENAYGINIILVKDIKEIDPGELCHWM